jgi:hypothetical protein
MLVAALFALLPSTAWAGCNTCATTTTPSPKPAQPSCGASCKAPPVTTPRVYIPSPNVVLNHIAPSVSASVSVSVGAYAGAQAQVYVGGGGGAYVGSFGGGGGFAGVETGGGMSLATTSGASQASSGLTRMVAIQAICMDDTGTPHPSSQTFADRMVAAEYRGEVFRCIAGTAMRVTFVSMKGETADFAGGETVQCGKLEALIYHGRKFACGAQEPKRPCNERSLLRRYGPGIKTAMLVRTETARTETRTQMTQMMFDGGVGQGVW